MAVTAATRRPAERPRRDAVSRRLPSPATDCHWGGGASEQGEKRRETTLELSPATTMGGTLQRAWRPGVKESLPLGAQTQRWSPDRPGEAQDASSASRRWRKG